VETHFPHRHRICIDVWS